MITTDPDVALMRALQLSIDRVLERYGIATGFEKIDAVISEIKASPPKIIDLSLCVVCLRPHAITMSALAWFQERGFPLPRRCASCRAARRMPDADPSRV